MGVFEDVLVGGGQIVRMGNIQGIPMEVSFQGAVAPLEGIS